jgi:hypothetical protein
MDYAPTLVTVQPGQTEFTIPWEYISTPHVKVYGEQTLLVEGLDYTYLSQYLINIPNASTNHTTVFIERVTPTDTFLVNFNAASSIYPENLTQMQKQLIYAAAELRYLETQTIALDPQGRFDALNKKIINLLDGVDPQDAATVGQTAQALADALAEIAALRVDFEAGIVNVTALTAQATGLVTLAQNSVTTSAGNASAAADSAQAAQQFSELANQLYLDTLEVVDTAMLEDEGDNRWNAENKVIKNLATPTQPTHATTKAYVDGTISTSVAGALSKNVTDTAWDAASLVIENLATPTAASHAANKQYVDSVAGSSSSATNLGYTPSATGGIVTSDTGADATLPAVNGANAGLVTPGMKSSWDGKISEANLGTTSTATQRTITSDVGVDVVVPNVTSSEPGFMTPAMLAQLNAAGSSSGGDYVISPTSLTFFDPTATVNTWHRVFDTQSSIVFHYLRMPITATIGVTTVTEMQIAEPLPGAATIFEPSAPVYGDISSRYIRFKSTAGGFTRWVPARAGNKPSFIGGTSRNQPTTNATSATVPGGIYDARQLLGNVERVYGDLQVIPISLRMDAQNFYGTANLPSPVSPHTWYRYVVGVYFSFLTYRSALFLHRVLGLVGTGSLYQVESTLLPLSAGSFPISPSYPASQFQYLFSIPLPMLCRTAGNNQIVPMQYTWQVDGLLRHRYLTASPKSDDALPLQPASRLDKFVPRLGFFGAGSLTDAPFSYGTLDNTNQILPPIPGGLVTNSIRNVSYWFDYAITAGNYSIGRFYRDGLSSSIPEVSRAPSGVSCVDPLMFQQGTPPSANTAGVMLSLNPGDTMVAGAIGCTQFDVGSTLAGIPSLNALLSFHLPA